MRSYHTDSKNMAVLLGFIAGTALLSLAIYSYSLSISEQISETATDDIRSNARVQARDLSLILTSGLDSIADNLQILSKSSSVLAQNDDASAVIDAAQNTTEELTDFYMWLDETGQIIWTTGDDKSEIGRDRSYREYFTVPQATGEPYFSDVIISSDSAPRIFVSYPVIADVDQNNGRDGAFRGVMVAGIRLDIVGTLLKQNPSDDFRRNFVTLLDNNGTILYARDTTLIGRGVHELGAVNMVELDPRIADAVLQAPDSFMADFTAPDGRKETVASEPVIINGKKVWTVYVTAPHQLTDDVRQLFDQQNTFITLMVAIFGALAFGIAFLILRWNKRLEASVQARTAELNRANKSLEETNRQLLSSNEQLKAHDMMQTEFINVASHEMKTPTQAILFHSDLLKRRPESNESVDAIARNAERLQKLTSNILDISRIESQSLKLNKEKFDLHDAITGVIDDYQRQMNAKYGDLPRVELLYEPVTVPVYADKNRIIQVISNLVSNAIEFTDEGTISVTAENSTDHVRVVVRDTGRGIDADMIPRLFTKFSTRSEKGMGLGLFICKSIVEAHGGRIWAENNKDGRGASFFFTISALADA